MKRTLPKGTGVNRAAGLRGIRSHRPATAWVLVSLGAKLLALAGPALAQPRFEYRTQIVSAQQQFSHISWRLNYPDHTEDLTQSYLPMVFDFAVARNAQLSIGTAGGWSEAMHSSSYVMNGVTDTHVRFSQRWSGRWMLGAGVNLPTGDSKLDDEENLVANKLTESILGFPVQRLGVGTDWEFSLAHAVNLSPALGLGFGGTVVLPGEFEFRQQSTDTYKPGVHYIFTTTLNHLGAVLPWRLSVLAQFYGQDQFNRQNVFKQGWQLEPALSGEWLWARDWKLGGSLR